MAAVSAPQAPSSLTPPSSSHGGQNSWNYAVPSQSENSQKPSEFSKAPSAHTNGHALRHQTSRTDLTQRRPEYTSTRSAESGYLAPARINALNRKDSSLSETGSAPDSLLDLYGNNRSGLNVNEYDDRKQASTEEDDQDHSRWIHRDKLARIESQELQAAGIILPRARAPSKSSRREHSRDQQGNGARSEQAQKRQRVESFPTEEEEVAENNVWDLRLPEEAAAGDVTEGYQDVSGGVKGVSRIPVLKTSPLPIPLLHLERDTPIRRSGLVEDDSIAYSKTRGRSQSIKVQEDSTSTPTPARRLVSENSPTKKTPLKKGSTPANRAASAGQRPKTRSGPNQVNGAGQRPPTRSGELGPSNSTNKRPEGDPPWLATMFKPDPRLPPDQQLLPTVARRLQQEQWEKEGKFGTTYDTDFRPLNDENPRSPEPAIVPQVVETKKSESSLDPEWPLRGPKSPALSTGRPGTAGTGSYSTMPKIHTGIPMGVGPLPSPNPPVRVQEPPEDAKKGGCGCCAVM